MAELFGADGRPIKSTSDDGAALADYVALPGIRDKGSHYEVDKEAVAKVRRERSRSLSLTSVPSTPRDMIRDIGGIAVGKGHGRWPHVTMDMLRDLRERAPILQPIHSARQYQVRRMAVKWPGGKGKLGIRVVHADHHEHDAVPPAGFDRFIAQFEQVLWKPAPPYGVNTLGTALTLLMEDLLTINRPTVELIPSLIDANRIVQWRPVDGALIWPTLLVIEKWIADNPRWSVGYDKGRLSAANRVDLISQKLRLDLTQAEFVLVREGIAEAVYPRGRLICAPIMNRTDVRYAGYPPSHVEQAMALISAFISTFDYNASYFTKGMLAEFILGLPAEMHDDDVDAFVDMFRESTMGTANAWRPPIVPLPHGGSEIQKIDLKQANREMMFEVWLSVLMSLTASIYRMDMSSLNAKPWDGGSGPKLGEGNRTEEIALAKEEGLQGDLGHIVENILNPIAMRCHPDLRVWVEYGDYDAEKEATVNEIRARVSTTRNQIRLEQGDEPEGFWLTREDYLAASAEEQQRYDDNPWNMPTDAVFASLVTGAKQRDQQQQMMAQQAAQGQQPADPSQGQPDGFGGADDGFGGAHPAHDPAPYGAPGGAPGGPKPPGVQKPGGAAKPPTTPLAKAVRTLTVHVHDDSDRSYDP